MNPTHLIIYAGNHYGFVHRVLSIEGRFVTAIHEQSGDIITVHLSDTEAL